MEAFVLQRPKLWYTALLSLLGVNAFDRHGVRFKSDLEIKV